MTAPLEYRLRLAAICLLGLLAAGTFFATAGLKSRTVLTAERKRAVASHSEEFLATEQQVLQDFIYESTDNYLTAVDDRKPLTYKGLLDFIMSDACDVSRFGVAGNDRLAVMLGSVPEMIVAFWAFSRQCCFAPMERKASSRETIFTLHDLPAKAVVVLPEDKAHFLEALIEVPIIECILDLGTTGLFSLKGIKCPVAPQYATTESVALVLQTAGTTRKPKLVPLTHQNLILTSATLVEMLSLTPEDCALNLAPLYHISGISNSIIAPVISHSSVICAPQFTRFTGHEAFELCLDYQATWYFGSPTIHMLMMHGQDPPRSKTVRLIRNATAALLPSTADEMSKFWGCEILPGYGMSECTPITGHQCGRLVRIASVGPAAAPQICIDEKGEILIKGPAVFSGYERRAHMEEDPEPNHGSFCEPDKGGSKKSSAVPQTDRWFHTGDCGWVDELGYFSITGRFKEIIIRGGQKISPLEVESQILDERILEKAAFSVTHEELGEVVGLAVKTRVPAEYLVALLNSVRRNSNLDHEKLPEVIVSVDELPKGLAGKIKRIGMQKRLGLPNRGIHRAEAVAYTFSPQTELVAVDFVDDLQLSALDSLAFAKQRQRDGVGSEIRRAVLAMYAAAAFFTVCGRAQLYLHFPKQESYFGAVMIRMLGASIPAGMQWNLQAFMMCASFLLSQEPFNGSRVAIMVLIYFLFRPFTQLVYWCAYEVSQEPRHLDAFYVEDSKRWFVFVLIIAYSSFATARNLPYHSLQCIILALLTAWSVICPPSQFALSKMAAGWLNYLFTLDFADGLHVWLGLVTVYFVVGYYGQKALMGSKNHPIVADPAFQHGLKIVCPVLFFGCLFIIFSSPALDLATDTAASHSKLWDPFTVLLDQGASLVLIMLLSQSVRSVAPWLTPLGACAFGIYLGSNIAYFCPSSNNDLRGASFGIIINRVAVLPPLQELMTFLGGCWPLQLLLIFLYCMFQMFVFGMPLHWVYLKLMSILDAQAKSSSWSS